MLKPRLTKLELQVLEALWQWRKVPIWRTICGSRLFFGMATWLLALALRPNRAAARYWIWLAASAKFLIPFSLLFRISHQLEWHPVRTIARPEVTNVVDAISRPFAPSVDISIPSAVAPTLHHLPTILLGAWRIGCLAGAMFLQRSLGQIREIRRAAALLDLDLPIPVMSSSAQLEPGVG